MSQADVVTVVVATALVRDGRVLAAQRSYPPEAAGRWELPGGRVEPGETEADALVRECREELGVDVVAGPRIGPAVPLRAPLVLHLRAAALVDGQEPRALEHRAVRWVGADELDDVDWLDADRAFLPAVAALLRPRS